MTGLRERKRATTKSAIQRQALRLFRERGYRATTVEQIAEAAEVAPSTVFRYFPTKEDLAALDDHYSLHLPIARAFEAQPPELNPVQALRGALRAAFAGLSPAERTARYERDLLMLQVPELWAANLGLLTTGSQVLADLVAARIGCAPDDPAVRALTGAALGIGLQVFLDWAQNPDADPAATLDEALSHLELVLPA